MEEKQTVAIEVTIKVRDNKQHFEVTEVKVDGEPTAKLDISQSRGGGHMWDIYRMPWSGLTLEWGEW